MRFARRSARRVIVKRDRIPNGALRAPVSRRSLESLVSTLVHRTYPMCWLARKGELARVARV